MPMEIPPAQAAAMAPSGQPACTPCQKAPRPATDPGPVLPDEPSTSWIGLVLKDDDGRPVPDQPVAIELSSGTRLSGRTDAEGKVRFEGVPRDAGVARFERIPDPAPDWQ